MTQYTIEELAELVRIKLIELELDGFDATNLTELVNPILGTNLIYVGDGFWEDITDVEKNN